MSDLRNLDLNLLVVFEAIYSTRNISQAARQLGVSQPTISNALTRLRDHLDDHLFVRAGRGVEPTSKSTQIIGPVRNALQAIKSGLVEDEEFDPTSTKCTFRMVLLDQLEPLLMPPVIHQIQSYHFVTLEVLPLSSTNVSGGLNDGTLDLALSVYVNHQDEYECEQIGRANIVVIARKGHPKISGKLTCKNFSELSHVALVPSMRALSQVDEMLQHHKIERHIAYAGTKFWSFPHIVANSDLIALIPGDFAKSVAGNYNIDIHPTPFEFPEQQVYMIWKKDRSDNTGHRWLRDQIRQAYKASIIELGGD